ncbi:MAG: hypothetical protein RBS78_02885 [Coriobacteriia bacterium]|jgi:hypothetical protein|nr:hypothetical protein [Coriobacteriia bacterium]
MTSTPSTDSGRLTVNDVRHHAEEVRDLARAEVRRVTRTDPARMVGYAVVGALVVASLAYYLGSRRCRPRDVPR